MPKYVIRWNVPPIAGQKVIEAANQSDAERAAHIAMQSSMETNYDWTWEAEEIVEAKEPEPSHG